MPVKVPHKPGESDVFLDPERIARECKAGFWTDSTIANYFDHALASQPMAEYLVAYRADVAEPVSLSFSDLSACVLLIETNLRRLGVTPGDVVSFQIPNWWQFIAVHLACVQIGAVSNPLMPIFRERELKFILDHCGSKVLVIPKTFRNFNYENLATCIQRQVSTLEHIIVIDGDHKNSLEAALLKADEPAAHTQKDRLQPNDIVSLMYTSGTTGEPKGVMHTSNTLLSSMKTVTNRMGLTADDVIFMPSPFAHSIGFCYGMAMSLYLGARLVITDTWDPVQAADIIERHGVTFMFAPTPFVADIVNLPDIEKRNLEQFRIFLTAGAFVPQTLADKAKTVLRASLVQGYGMTELGLVTVELPSGIDRGSTTAGPALPHAELRVVDSLQRELTAGNEGELQCRGSGTFVGYYKHPDLYTVDEQGWFSTGDLATMDEAGYMRIVGRIKDIIIRGGENIPVVEVENLIHEMSRVDEVAIVGMPDERLGERSCAFVTVRAGKSLTFEQLKEFLAGKNLAQQYIPEKLVIIDHFPKTPSGKIQKFKLRD